MKIYLVLVLAVVSLVCFGAYSEADVAIIYCDYLTGDDGTGDGTAGNPYKTITQASLGLAGGDEVRVAKSTANVALTGTVGFTKGSKAVVGTGTLFLGELVIGDFIEGGDSNWWEVVVITDNTHATLYQKYSSATGAGVAAVQLGVTSTGAATGANDPIQTVSVSGTSAASLLLISGGWDLGAGPTQDGQTYFRQMHGVFANRWGRGLYATVEGFVEIERLHFLRYRAGLFFDNIYGCTITSPTCGGNGLYGAYLSSIYNNTILTPACNGNGTHGVYLVSGYNNTITSPTCGGNGTYGIGLNNSRYNTISTPTCNGASYGIDLYRSCNNLIPSATCNDNTIAGIHDESGYQNKTPSFSGAGNGTDISITTPGGYGEIPCLGMQSFGGVAGDDRQYFEFGETYKNVAEARAGACLKYDPSSATYYISQSFFCKVTSGVQRTVKLYIKDDVAFNGDVQAALYFLGEKITGWSAWAPTVNYVEKSIIAGAGDITEDGILELRVKVRGAAGNVYVDDFAYE